MVSRIAFCVLFCAWQLMSAPAFEKPPEVGANPNPAAPLSAVLRLTHRGATRILVDISDGKHSWTQHFDTKWDAERGLPLVGMRPGRKHQIRVTILDAKGSKKVADPLEYTTPPLKADGIEFPEVRVRRLMPGKMEPGVTLFNPRRSKKGDIAFGAGFGMLLAVDDEGEPVWVYKTDSRVNGFERLPSGNIVFITQDYRIVEIDLLGNVVRQWYATGRPKGRMEGAAAVETTAFHHGLTFLPSGNLVAMSMEVRQIDGYYSSETDKAAPRKRQKVAGDEIVEFGNDGKVVWKWNAFDWMDPFRIGYETFEPYWQRRGFPEVIDWSHGNKLRYDAADDSLLVSFRLPSAIAKIDRKTRQVRWVLGEPSGWDGPMKSKLFRLADGAQWFYHQHALTPTPKGTLLVFDNNNYRARPFDPPADPAECYSRAIEYRLDEKTREAKEVWTSETKGDDSVLSRAMGEINFLPKTGNILVHYGALYAKNPARKTVWNENPAFEVWTRIREYTHESKAQLVWELTMGDASGSSQYGWSSFGGGRYASLLP